MSVERVAVVGSIVAVVAAVIAGLLVMGSPGEQRLLRLDDQRVMDLRQLSFAAENRWTEARGLPATASELVDGRYLSRLPVDPVSGEPYAYRVTGPRQFELCAEFARPSRPALEDDFWFHEAGPACFSFDVAERGR
jgi:hypothetical protein